MLLIANPYDAFMLEDDGRIDEKISMNTLLCLCAIHLVSRRYLRRRKHCHSWKYVVRPGDLYAEYGDNDSFDIGRHIKEKYEHIPIVILTPLAMVLPNGLSMKI